jgi:predicted AAA+ superfamily ATPase
MYTRFLKIPAKIPIILLGPRQTGKSTFLNNFLHGKKYLNIDLLDHDQFMKYQLSPEQLKKDLVFQIEREVIEFVVIDEIQKIPELLDIIHSLIEKKYSCQFILTGSSARKIKKQNINLLGGRAALLKMFPFIFNEVKTNFNLDEQLQYGTICGLYDDTKENKILKLKSYLETYIKDEILSEGMLRKLPPFYRFIDLIGQLSAEIINYSNIGREAHTSEHTIKSYFQILEETFIGYYLPAFDVSVKRSMSLHPKFYLFDCGLTNVICQRLNDPLDNATKGKLFEQWIINEIRAHISYENKERTLFFWRTKEGNEVDLLITKGQKPVLGIEIKYKEKISKSDFAGINKLKEDYPQLTTWVISNVSAPYEENETLVLPWEYFLSKKIIEI